MTNYYSRLKKKIEEARVQTLVEAANQDNSTPLSKKQDIIPIIKEDKAHYSVPEARSIAKRYMSYFTNPAFLEKLHRNPKTSFILTDIIDRIQSLHLLTSTHFYKKEKELVTKGSLSSLEVKKSRRRRRDQINPLVNSALDYLRILNAADISEPFNMDSLISEVAYTYLHKPNKLKNPQMKYEKQTSHNRDFAIVNANKPLIKLVVSDLFNIVQRSPGFKKYGVCVSDERVDSYVAVYSNDFAMDNIENTLIPVDEDQKNNSLFSEKLFSIHKLMESYNGYLGMNYANIKNKSGTLLYLSFPRQS